MVHLHFQAKPWDLYLVLGYTLVVSTLLLTRGGNLIGIILVLFVPGYVLTDLLFPQNSEIDWIERLCLSIGLSIAVVPLLALVLNFTPPGITLESVVIAIAVFSGIIGYAAFRKREQLEPNKRMGATIVISRDGWKDYSIFDKVLAILLVLGIGVAVSVLAALALTPQPGERFTEFYTLGPLGNASSYPTALNISQPWSEVVGIENHESAPMIYTVRIDLVGIQIVYNATTRVNQTIELNRTTWSTFDVALSDGKNWTKSYTFRINDKGLWKVQFLLFRSGDLSLAYRELHLYVRVS